MKPYRVEISYPNYQSIKKKKEEHLRLYIWVKCFTRGFGPARIRTQLNLTTNNRVRFHDP